MSWGGKEKRGREGREERVFSGDERARRLGNSALLKTPRAKRTSGEPPFHKNYLTFTLSLKESMQLLPPQTAVLSRKLSLFQKY